MDLGAEDAATMARLLMEASDDEVGSGCPSEGGISVVPSPPRLGSEIIEIVWGISDPFTLLPVLFRGLVAAGRSLAKANRL